MKQVRKITTLIYTTRFANHQTDQQIYKSWLPSSTKNNLQKQFTN